MIFCADTILNSAVVAACPGWVSSTRSAVNFEGYGASLKQRVPEELRHLHRLRRARRDDPQRKLLLRDRSGRVDQWGIPVLRFHWKWSDNEIKMAKDMQETFREIVETAGGTFITHGKFDGSHPYGILDGGSIIHELGWRGMGVNPKTSVLNKYCQAHEVKNLFVTDGSRFRSNPDKNPTLTIMALSWRASEYLMEQAKEVESL